MDNDWRPPGWKEVVLVLAILFLLLGAKQVHGQDFGTCADLEQNLNFVFEEFNMEVQAGAAAPEEQISYFLFRMISKKIYLEGFVGACDNDKELGMVLDYMRDQIDVFTVVLLSMDIGETEDVRNVIIIVLDNLRESSDKLEMLH